MEIVVDDKCNTLKHDRDSSWADCNSVEARLVKKIMDGDILLDKNSLEICSSQSRFSNFDSHYSKTKKKIGISVNLLWSL